MKAKNAFLVSRIGMALRPLRPIDTANIIKNPNTPNNQTEKIDADFGFYYSSLILEPETTARNQAFSLYMTKQIGRDIYFPAKYNNKLL